MRHLLLLVVAACGAADSAPARTTDQRAADSAPAITALRASKFDDANKHARAALALDPRNSRAAAVRAITSYRAAGHDLIVQLQLVLEQGASLKAFDHAKGREAWTTFLSRLDAIDRDLAIVAADPDFALEICLACWEHDWNRSGEIDENDRKMFEIEFDGAGGELAEGDPRRRPTFRFDVGDAEWARAMIAFQRAAVELVLAYKWSELDRLFSADDFTTLTIRLDSKQRVRHAHSLVLAGIEHAARCRTAYLAETDDDREWVPNPTQRSFAMPLPVDKALYDTWLGVLSDVRAMLRSETGISLREAKGLAEIDDDFPVPDGFIDIGAMLREPKDIVIDLSKAKRRDTEGMLRDLLGNGYKKSMKPSPIVSRLRRMKNELSRGEDTLGRKLRYLLWLN